MAGFEEAIAKIFQQGGKGALLGDLYLTDGTIHVTNWDEHVPYIDPIDGSTAIYSPAPFAVSEEAIVKDPKEVNLLKIFMGIVRHKDSAEFDNFTVSQIEQFSELMEDLDEYFETHDIRGSLVVVRLINVDDLTADLHIYTGIIDQYSVSENGLALELAEAEDILDAPSYPVSTMCPFRFGDSRTCQVNADSAANLYQGSVGAGSSTSSIIDASIPNGDNYWRPGIIKMTSGASKGQAREIKSYDSGTNTVTVTVPFETSIAAGDTFDLRRVCRKTAEICENTFNNLERFGGYKYVNNPIQGLFYRGR